ncbi:acyl carrier protein [Paenibacillus melissococcoides]|uniref:Acyl carrier protein n=1 Tax=Paenibacillus melissococcoides TaxID=2912268 RepID=A0ABM9GBN9_9BACL|nr:MULTISPECIES: acyl carrier protein [Paenibacillus]MEB9895030.1 acyl carrier protein [Bacillus cereus]GIO82269.1 hypothetical protein J6TS7_58790 [Paenibacillus dendritiformis]CAH8249552.1 acyl carrier protein [Paenibacillus melissococcoides]CAH8721085.1 acyl carrier protein [Paenibacillus melissococcoides]
MENIKAHDNVHEVVIHYLAEVVAEKNVNLTDEMNILEGGLIDSLGVMNLINFLESKFGFEIQDHEFEMENFQTINSIVALVHKYIN